jgi:soluble lytic murein transglycosylase-like protein
MIRAYLIFVMGILLTGMFFNGYRDVPQQEPPNVEIWEELSSEEGEDKNELDIFVEAERITGCPAEILRGIAGAESHFKVSAVGDNGQSHGMFQLHSRWYDSRVEKYGDFDPFDPANAAIIAGYIIQENLRQFDGNLRLAIAAYKQGVTGVNRNGAIDWYVDEVLSWRKDEKKMLAFFVFQGITEIGRLEDGYFGYGSQVAYKPDDSVVTPVSWRGSSGLPY